MKSLNGELPRLTISYTLKRFRQRPLDMLITLAKSAKFVLQDLRTLPKFRHREELCRHSMSRVEVDGLFLEFGVYKGTTINYVASLVPEKTVYGFDSFEGLPEDWAVIPKGFFRLNQLPKVRSNVKLVVGLFQETLEPFLEKHADKVAFIHMDADLYSSTKYVLSTLAKHNRLQRGTVIQFDQLFNYIGWWNEGEYRAFLRFVKQFNVEFEYLGYHMSSGVGLGVVSIKILKI